MWLSDALFVRRRKQQCNYGWLHQFKLNGTHLYEFSLNISGTLVTHEHYFIKIQLSIYLQPVGSVTNGIEAFSEFSAHQWSARKVVARPRLLCTLLLLLTNHLGCFGVARLVGDVGQNVRISALSCAEAMKRVLCHGSCTSMIPTDDRIGLYHVGFHCDAFFWLSCIASCIMMLFIAMFCILLYHVCIIRNALVFPAIHWAVFPAV